MGLYDKLADDCDDMLSKESDEPDESVATSGGGLRSDEPDPEPDELEDDDENSDPLEANDGLPEASCSPSDMETACPLVLLAVVRGSM